MDGAVVDFSLTTPGDEQTILRQIAHAMSLNLPSVTKNWGAGKSIDLIASGPSAKAAPLGKRAATVNNALNLFQGDGPKFWIACDPQELVADFIPEDPPINTTYLIATKCHPKVFEKLKGRKVLLWQIDDYELQPDILAVPTAVSVTLCAINLLAQMGYDQINTWGWDGCYIEGDGYALPQDVAEQQITVHLNGKQYPTTHAWACEAEDARNQFIRDAGYYSVTVNGPGMIGAIVRHFQAAA